jgi:hypothetical protein
MMSTIIDIVDNEFDSIAGTLSIIVSADANALYSLLPSMQEKANVHSESTHKYDTHGRQKRELLKMQASSKQPMHAQKRNTFHLNSL